VQPARSTRCPFCLAPQPPQVEGASSTCAYCGSDYVVSAALCPRCGRANPDDAEACLECGEPLTTVGRVFQRHRDARRPPQFLEFARQQAPALKRSEGEASRRRTEAFGELEADRVEKLRVERERQAAKDRVLVIIGVASVGALIILFVAVMLSRLLLS
jgi:hypothetical protein